MFFYNVSNILQRNRMRTSMDDTLLSSTVTESTYLLDSHRRRRLHYDRVFIIPQRYVLGIMGFFAIVNAYTMRVSLSVAITEMVLPKNLSTHYDPNGCAGYLSNTSNTVTNPDRLYPWTSKQQGLILSSFYWGYVVTHIPGGIIAERFGGKYVLGLGILCTAIFTFITPFVIYFTDGHWGYVILLRIIEGLGEGTTFPALNVLLAKWVPAHERSKIGTLVFAGSQIGTVFGNGLSGALIANTKEWSSVFYVFGVLAILWVFLWMGLCYTDPESHPFISDREKEYLARTIVNVSKEKKKIPWKSIMLSPPVLALIAAQIGHDWGFFAMVTDLPKYMKDVLKFNVAENGIWSSVPYLFMWIVSMLSGCLCDFLITKNYMSVTWARKFFTTLASMGPAVFILAASYSGCNRDMAVGMFTVAMGFMGTFYCGMKVNALDLAPNFAGTVMALVNGIGAFTGIIVPYLIGALTEDHTLLQWRTVFWITLGVFAVTNIVYICFASGEVQSWNDGSDKEKEQNKNSSIIENKYTVTEKY